MTRALGILIACTMLCVGLVNAEPKVTRGAVYKSTSADGRVNYSNVKPPKNVKSTMVLFTYVETAYGATWISLGYGTDGAEILVNSKDKKRDAKLASIWVLTNYPKVTLLPGTQISLRPFIELWKINCDTDETWQAERVGYTEAFGTGDVVGQWKFYPQASTAIPGTFGAAIVKSACQIVSPAKK